MPVQQSNLQYIIINSPLSFEKTILLWLGPGDFTCQRETSRQEVMYYHYSTPTCIHKNKYPTPCTLC